MKRLILPFTAAILTFGLGFAVDRILISRSYEAPVQETVKVEPVTANIPEIKTPIATSSVPAADPMSHGIFDFDPKKFDPMGAYYLMGNKPKEFSEFESIEIWSEEIESKLSVSVVIHTDANSSYETHYAVFSWITPHRLIFVTSPQSDAGFEYRFDGEFLRTNLASFAGKNKAVLRGTLTKVKNSRKVSQRVFSFMVEYYDC
jgi:hypothetical protein